MQKWLSIIVKVLVWLVLMGTYFNIFVVNGKAPFYLTTDWFSNNTTSSECYVNSSPQGYEKMCITQGRSAASNTGFPLLMYGWQKDASGPHALVWAINLFYMGLVGVGLAYILMGKFKNAAIAGGVLILTYGLLAVIVNLF